MLKKIKQFFEKEDIRIFGYHNLNEKEKNNIFLSSEIRDLLNSVVVFGIPLSMAVIKNLQDGPDLLYLHHYRQANYLLDKTAYRLALAIEEIKQLAIPVPASQIIDWHNQTAHLSHKYFAPLCGIGWLGRNNLIVHPQYRSRLRFASVITSIRFEENLTIPKFGCGNCRKCIEICPAKAISENPANFNHTACFEKIKEITRHRRISQHICGLCIKACEKWEQ
ncbi:MAG TPA: hypothetical protein PKX05_02125 [bacterium]|nr:hypothetical protein [bacterium]